MLYVLNSAIDKEFQHLSILFESPYRIASLNCNSINPSGSVSIAYSSTVSADPQVRSGDVIHPQQQKFGSRYRTIYSLAWSRKRSQ